MVKVHNKQIDRLALKANFDEDRQLARVRKLNDERLWNPYATIGRAYEAKALVSWFKDGDLSKMKQHAYTAAKLRRMATLHYSPHSWVGAFVHLFALLSNHKELIHWYSQIRSTYFEDEERKLIPRNSQATPVYHGFQALLALQGKWDCLGARAEYILKNPSKKMAKYQIDHEFYLALAKGDKIGMELALNTLTSPNVAKRRNKEPAFGLTEDLISTFGVIYAKIAYLHGYELDLDPTWIPQEWLSMTPLDSYDEEYDFMGEFDLYTKLPGEFEPFSPVKGSAGIQDITLKSFPS